MKFLFFFLLLNFAGNVTAKNDTKFICSEVHVLNTNYKSPFSILLKENNIEVFLEDSHHILVFTGIQKKVGTNKIEYQWKTYKNDFLEIRTLYPLQNLFVIKKWNEVGFTPEWFGNCDIQSQKNKTK